MVLMLRTRGPDPTVVGKRRDSTENDAPKGAARLSANRYAVLADFRYELRRFLHFSEQAARREGVSPQQHQALLAIRGSPGGVASVGTLADRLLIKPNSASGLANRLVGQDLLERVEGEDRRTVLLRLTSRAEEILARLSRAHLTELKRIGPLLDSLLQARG